MKYYCEFCNHEHFVTLAELVIHSNKNHKDQLNGKLDMGSIRIKPIKKTRAQRQREKKVSSPDHTLTKKQEKHDREKAVQGDVAEYGRILIRAISKYRFLFWASAALNFILAYHIVFGLTR